MKWIYDETLAREHLQKYKNDVREENSRREKENKRVNFFHSLWVVGTLVVATILILLVCFLVPADDNGLKSFCVFGICMIAVIVIAFVCFYFSDERYDFLDAETQRWWKPPPTDVEYLLATEGKTVLSRDCTKDRNKMVVSVTLENKEHFVSKVHACELTRKTSTAVSEEVADLVKGLYLIPYTPSRGKNRERCIQKNSPVD